MNIPFVAYSIFPDTEYLINHKPYADMITWWFCWNFIPFKVGYKEFITTLAFNFVVWISKQYTRLFGNEVSLTNMYFLVRLIDEKDEEGLGRYI